MWSKISSALKPRDGNDADQDHSDAPPPDPFRANATTYYTHQTPPTPPSGVHSRTASREEDIIWSLRTQLALQQELCAQFEIDLRARDELVEALTIRLEASEKENEKRRSVIRTWKKKAAHLEKLCRHLEEEVDNSRQESVERSIMDVASGEALRQLHRQLSQLEREKKDIEAERNSLAQAADDAQVEITRLREKIGSSDRASGEAAHQISQLEQEKRDIGAERDSLAQAADDAQVEITRLREKIGSSDRAGGEAAHQISRLEREKEDIGAERDSLAQAAADAQAELTKLREKIGSSDRAGGEAARQISQLEREKSDVETERDAFLSEITRLRSHIQQLQKDSAVKEVTIVQLNKQLDQDKEDIDGLNIALESKQQELELVKRKHGVRGTLGVTSGRTNSAPSAVGKQIGNAAPPSTLLRASAVGPLTSPPVPSRVPSALGRVANTRPPVSSALRRASSSIVESKSKPSTRRLSIASPPSEADEKENASESTPVLTKHPRRTMVVA